MPQVSFRRFGTAALVALTACAFFAFAGTASAGTTGDLLYSITDDKVTIHGCDANAGDCPEAMVIPSTIEGLPVTKIAYGAFYTAWGVKSVSLPSSLTEIGGYAFGFNLGLTAISIPASVTKINESAFANAKNLANVNFAGNAPEVGTDAFIGIATGAKANLSNSSQTGFGYNGDSFAGLVVTGGIDPPPYEFYVGAEAVTITGCRGGAAACPETLSIPSTIAGKPVTTIAGGAFYASPTLTGVTLPDSVTEIGNFAFYHTPLNRITLGSGLTTIGIAAFAYTNLTSITIPASVTSIGGQAFSPTESLLDVVFQGIAPTVAVGAFAGTGSGATATLASPSLTGYGLNGDLFDALIVRGGVPRAPLVAGAPSEPTKSTSANFTMTGEEGATFKCSVDGAHYKACASPFTVNRLAAGNHTLRIIQTGVNGAESAPASASWTVVELDAPTVAGKVGLKFNFSTRVTTLNLAASADQADQPNPIKWIEYFSHPTRPAASARQNPKKIRQYGTTVVLPAREVAFWVRVKDTKGKWSGWYQTKK